MDDWKEKTEKINDEFEFHKNKKYHLSLQEIKKI
jgi:hypothetical protein